MDTLTACTLGMMSRGRTSKVFDFDKALEIIKNNKIKNAEAGLQMDMEWTLGIIVKDGILVTDDYTYLGSTWATPIMVDLDTSDTYECWCWNNPIDNPNKYNSGSKWEERHFKEFNK